MLLLLFSSIVQTSGMVALVARVLVAAA